MSILKLKEAIRNYPDFPKEGILFKDILPIFLNHDLHAYLIEKMSKSEILNSSEAIIAIESRGFLLGSSLSLKLSKPLILARKPGKLAGKIISSTYKLEYGSDSLSIQEESIKKFKKFAIVDDLIATGGSIKCVSKIISSQKKEVSGACVAIELSKLNAKKNLDFPLYSEVSF